jgi:hypothetical protein
VKTPQDDQQLYSSTSDHSVLLGPMCFLGFFFFNLPPFGAQVSLISTCEVKRKEMAECLPNCFSSCTHLYLKHFYQPCSRFTLIICCTYSFPKIFLRALCFCGASGCCNFKQSTLTMFSIICTFSLKNTPLIILNLLFRNFKIKTKL